MNRYSQLSDGELLSHLLNGDECAFITVYERYARPLYVYAFKKLKDKHAAQDIVHDVFTSFWQRREEVNLRTELSSYLFSAVRNKAFDNFARKEVQAKHLKSLQEFLMLSTTSPADYLIRTQQLDELIKKEIQALPERMREIFILSRQKQLSHLEIAEQLDISKHTVDTQIKRALRILKHKLGPVTTLNLLFQACWWM